MKATLEQIQHDLSCLLDGFGVADQINWQGITLEELACQIVVDNFNRLNQPEPDKERYLKWSWYETMGVPWHILNSAQQDEIKKQFPYITWEDVCWASVLVEKE